MPFFKSRKVSPGQGCRLTTYVTISSYQRSRCAEIYRLAARKNALNSPAMITAQVSFVGYALPCPNISSPFTSVVWVYDILAGVGDFLASNPGQGRGFLYSSHPEAALARHTHGAPVMVDRV